jgi:mono/diheme cytochrome c family protein
MSRFLAGFVAAFVVLGAAGFIIVWFGLFPAGADTKASPLERWAASRALHAAIRRDTVDPPASVHFADDATAAGGARLYMANCAVCHGSGQSHESPIAAGLYIRAPQFARHGVDDDPPGTTYWKIAHGIRFSGMPAFAGSLTEAQMWQIAAFLKHPADALPGEAKVIWNAKPAS